MSKDKEDKQAKYGVDDFAKKAGVKPATARVMLRKNKIKKFGKNYGWNSTTDLEAAVKKCRPAEKKETKKPAKKASKKVSEGAGASA